MIGAIKKYIQNCTNHFILLALGYLPTISWRLSACLIVILKAEKYVEEVKLKRHLVWFWGESDFKLSFVTTWNLVWNGSKRRVVFIQFAKLFSSKILFTD